MATGDHDWTAGEQVTAANMDDYLQLQVVQQFATAAARDSALTARKREGMVTYQIDTNTLTVYSGAAWSTIGPAHGAQLSWVPTLTQNVTPTFSVTNATYCRIGRRILGEAELLLTAGTPGTAANGVIVGLPVAHGLSTNTVIGTGMLFDQSGGFKYKLILVAGATSVTARFYEAGTTGDVFTGTTGQFTAALTTSDFIAYSFSYPASGDA